MNLLKFIDFVCACESPEKGVLSFHQFLEVTIINLINSPYFQGEKV